MKRPLCICLAISLVLCMALPAAAQEPNEGRAAAIHQHFISYLDANGVGHQFPDGSGEEMATVDLIADIDGWTIFLDIPALSCLFSRLTELGIMCFCQQMPTTPMTSGFMRRRTKQSIP